jgi:N-formylglutamate deformylase
MSAILIGIPHASVAWPDELRHRVLPHVDEQHLRANSDAFTDRIYSVPGVRTVVYPWSRFVADPNRAPRQVSEGGVIPVTDFDDQPIYRPGQEPDAEELVERVRRYHRPYHDRLREAAADPRTRFFVDAHSMAGDAPAKAFDHGRPRPDAVVSNLGETRGNPSPGTPFLSAAPDLTRWLADRLKHHLLALPAPDAGSRARITGQVWMNNPFNCGYGVRAHAQPNKGRPGIQLELNQRMWTDEQTFRALPRRIPWIREVVRRWAVDVTAHLAQLPARAG